jgi:hypothetical protein
MRTVKAFMPAFFEELQKDGQVDRAVTIARGTVRDHYDWWMPVLFMRLKSGRIWYVPGFGENGQDFEKWPALVYHIQAQKCTPIIGPRLTGVSDSMSDMAHQWAERYHFPLAPHQSEELHQVAQYLSVSQDFDFPRYELVEHLREDVLEHYGSVIDASKHAADLEELFAEVSKHTLANNPTNPYKVLAEQPFPIYITANVSNLLTEALIAAGKEPRVELCRWNEDLESLPSVYDDDPDYQPDEQQPLVYHLFGHIKEPDSFVITEDDYFDYLMGVTSNRDLIPVVIREALTDTGLLFLGFQLDDWSFRVLFRSLMRHGMRGRRKRYAHVAGQVAPDEGRILQPSRAKAYLESYFGDANIDIFWGSVDDFIQALLVHMNEDSDRGQGRRTRRPGRRRR